MSKVKAWESTYTPGHKNPKVTKSIPGMELKLYPLRGFREAWDRAMKESTITVLGSVTDKITWIDEASSTSYGSWRDYVAMERIEKPKPLDYRTVFPEVVIDADAWNALVKERYPWLF